MNGAGMRLTVLIDNNGSEELPGEWGLCLYVEYEGKKILYDTGQSEQFLANARTLGVDPASVDLAVLS